jgi:uracil-DNA glycosylase
MLTFNKTYYYKTVKNPLDAIIIIDVDLQIIYKNYTQVIFVNTDKKIAMMLSVKEIEDFKTVNNIEKGYYQLIFVPNIQNYLTNLQLKMLSKFHHTWYNNLYDYINTVKFMNELIGVSNDAVTNHIYPKVEDRFKMFNIQNFNNIKVVFVSLDPYTTDDATGIGFATNQYKKPKSLLKIEKALQLEYKTIKKLDSTLLPLVKQGIMFLNISLTSIRNKKTNITAVGEHIKYWKNFTISVLNSLNNKNNPVIFVFLGSKAQTFSNHISSKHHYIIKIEHPAKACYEDRDWIHNNLFENINETLLKHNLTDILWI